MKNTPSVRRLLQALYYIQSRVRFNKENCFNRMYLLKLLFLADRYHIRHFGITATGDNYYAIKKGPVASLASDILKNEKSYIDSAEWHYLSNVTILNKNETLIEKQDEDELSESVMQSIDFAIKEFGNYNQFQLSEISHCYPEWKKHEDCFKHNDRMRIEIEERDFFDDPDIEGYARLAEFGKKEDPFGDDRDFLELLREDAFSV